MAARAAGALFAFVAALLLLAALAGAIAPTEVPGWRDGHPRVGAKVFERKAIHAGLLGAHGCNLGPDGSCESIDGGALLEPLGAATLGALGLATLTLIGLLVSIWRIGERRKALGRIVAIEALIAAGLAAAWLAVGVDIEVDAPGGKATVEVPIGLGAYALGGGALAAVIAGALARRVEREPLRLKTGARTRSPSGAPPQPASNFDIGEVVEELAGAQLRPLYDVANVVPPGAAPAAAAIVPARVPTPAPTVLPSLVFAEDAAEPTTTAPPPQPPAPTTPPPARPTPMPVRPTPPPTTPPPKKTTSELAPIGAKPARTKAASLPPPVLPTTPRARNASAQQPPVARQSTTTTHAVPPMPGASPSPLAARAETVADPATTVEIDAEAKAKWQAQQAARRGLDLTAPSSGAAARELDDAAAAFAAQHAAAVAIADAPTTAAPPIDFDAFESAEAPTSRAKDTSPTPLAAATAPTREQPSEPDPDDEGPTAHARTSSDGADSDHTDILRAVEPAAPAPAAIAIPSPKSVPLPSPRPSGTRPPQITVPKIIAPKPIAPAPDKPAADKPADKHDKPEPKIPLSTASPTLPPPKESVAAVGPSPACPQCEAPMAWVDEHLRFFCSQCRMYF